jgi:ribosome biogenesis protein UTP30
MHVSRHRLTTLLSCYRCSPFQSSIKIANISHKDSQVLANLKTAIPAVVARIHGGWDNVQSLNIKTSSSVSLPIWTCLLGSDEPGSRWAGMGVEEGEWGGIGDAGSEDEAVAVEVEATPKKNGKKRAADADAEGEPVDAGTKKAKKTKPSELSTPASSAPIAEPTAQPAKEPSSKKSKKRAVAEDTPSASIAVSSVPSNTPTDKPAKEPSSQKSKKRAVAEDSPSASIAVSPVPSKIPVDKPATSKKQPSEQMLTRDELKKKKKDTLGDAKLEKKKGKLRETEKSTRKGVKAQLVGRIKA